MLLVVGVTFAQTKITGTVVEANGEPAIGATVQVQGGKNGTATDINGHFAIEVPQGKKLVFLGDGRIVADHPRQSAGEIASYMLAAEVAA